MTALSKNVYFEVLDNIVNKYNNTINRTIKTKPVDVTCDSNAENTTKIPKKKNLNLKLVIVLGYQNTKQFLLRNISKTGRKKFLSLTKLKIQLHGDT